MEELATLQVRRLHPDARLPARGRPHDAGYDLATVEAFTLEPGQRTLAPTGLAIALPPGVAGLVTPRSGLAIRDGITALNAPGLIDPNYRGELKVVLHNAGDAPFHAEVGDRIAQLLLVPYLSPLIEAVQELPPSPDERGEAGFGSSGR
ncbi:MAG: dUTP diphosphatase [Solirubrobacterales bacterium]|nr:dUTP diphosphatase [Solirubrobacterales bacterium]